MVAVACDAKVDGAKLTVTLTVKVDEEDVDALDRYVRACQQKSGFALSRSVVARRILREYLRGAGAYHLGGRGEGPE